MYIQVREFGSSFESRSEVIRIPSMNSTIGQVKKCIRNHFFPPSSSLYSPSSSFNSSSFSSQMKGKKRINDGEKEEEEKECIRIFFDGKELQSKYTIHEYGIKFNHILQILTNERRQDANLEFSSSASLDASAICEFETAVFENPESPAPPCEECKDDPRKKCQSCACATCGGKDDPEKTLICDECDCAFHMYCLPIPMESLPPDGEDWFCPGCKNEDLQLIQAKENAKLTSMRKRLNSESLLRETKHSKDGSKWGRGMACVGRRFEPRQKFCHNYFGAIPGIEVGATFRFRFQLSELGIHTPMVAGISGKESIGACSIVFGSSYPDDVDLGDTIYFTGSGGTNSSSKSARTGNVQVSDQKLTRSNRALAHSCFAPIDDINGADAGKNWRSGKPIRVCRSGNARGASKRSIYLPKIGIRYDGIYKVVKYWREISPASGFQIWRFLLRRDDEAPPPWTRTGYNRIRRLKLEKIIDPIKTPSFGQTSTYQDQNLNTDQLGVQTLITETLKNQTPFNEMVKIGDARMDCPICLQSIEDAATLFPCRHSFDFDCIKKWASSTDYNQDGATSGCPACRCSVQKIRLKGKEISSLKGLKRIRSN